MGGFNCVGRLSSDVTVNCFAAKILAIESKKRSIPYCMSLRSADHDIKAWQV